MCEIQKHRQIKIFFNDDDDDEDDADCRSFIISIMIFFAVLSFKLFLLLNLFYIALNIPMCLSCNFC